MSKEFKLPELGENISAGTVGKILVTVGDVIAAGQNVIEIETDKAVAEIPTSVAGRVTDIRVKEGGTVRVGDVVLVVDESASAPAPVPAAVTPPSPPPPPAAPAASAKSKDAPPAAQQAVTPESGATAHPGMVRAAPSVRQMARELGINLNDVPSLDPSGRITAHDVLIFSQSLAAGSAPAAPYTAAPVPAPAEAVETINDKWGAVIPQPMNTVRFKTAERMAENWATIPHVTHFEKADITSLEELRHKAAKRVEAAGGKLTVTSFVLKALAEALKRFPKFNAAVDMQGRRVLLRQYYNIGVAVDTPNGLLVPVLRDVDKKSVTQISVELPELAKKARDRKLTLDDMQGGTFTVSNLGGLGGSGFTPIINAPEVAILGMSRSQVEPVWLHGQFTPRLMLPLSLSYDHRLIDGADAARFLRWLVEVIEQPWKLFLED
jgi:pyruvate dehydrogenase E2 component (dihydrolipoamide acetyltransferase)